MQRSVSGGGKTPVCFRTAGGVLLAVHLLLVCWLTLRPLDVPWVSPVNLHPVDGIRADLALGPREAVHRLGGELLLLAPLGVLLPMTTGRLGSSTAGSLLRTVTAAALLSTAIALLQTGVPGRVADIDSVLLNPLGVAVVHLTVVPAARARLRRTAGAGPAGAADGRAVGRAGGRMRGAATGTPVGTASGTPARAAGTGQARTVTGTATSGRRPQNRPGLPYSGTGTGTGTGTGSDLLRLAPGTYGASVHSGSSVPSGASVR